MEKHSHYGHRSRIRDRVRAEGLDNFKDYQVLEYALTFVIPYKDTNPIAHALISKFGSLTGVLEASVEDIKTIDGMGEVSAHFLNALLQIFNWCEKEKANTVTTLHSPSEAFAYFDKIFRGKSVEQLYVVALTPKGKIVRVQRISEGSSGETSGNIRTITDLVSESKVSNIIVAHNHPKGESRPSSDDDKFTKALVTTLAINGCHLLDHMIVGDTGYYSYRQSGLIDHYKEDVAHLLLGRAIAQCEAPYGEEVDL